MKLSINLITRKGGKVRETESGGLLDQAGQAFGLTLFAGSRCGPGWWLQAVRAPV